MAYSKEMKKTISHGRRGQHEDTNVDRRKVCRAKVPEGKRSPATAAKGKLTPHESQYTLVIENRRER